MEEEILKALKRVTKEKQVILETPENAEFGDYSSNVALRMGSKGGRKPRDMAEKIKEELQKDKNLSKIVEKIEVAGPGFINFWLSKDILIDNLIQIDRQKEKYGNLSFLAGKRIMLEFGQPNTHKLPHIGHLFSYIYGESLARIIEKAGASVFRANYQGDVGLHVAKCLWALTKENPKIPESLDDKVMLLQKMYVKGNQAYEEGGQAEDEIVDLNLKIYGRDKSIIPLWEKTRSWSIDYYKNFESQLGITYDKSYFESEVYQVGIDIVKKNIGKVFISSQDAIIFEGSKFGLHDRVFLTKYQTPTYEAKDLALQTLKYRDWPYDLLIITTANEQNDYFKVIFKALELINPQFKNKLKHIGFGMVNLKGGRLSSRAGTIIGAVELTGKVVLSIRKIIARGRALTEKEKEGIAQSVGLAAVKYSFLKNNPLQNISFDIGESISKEGNSGPYLQYTYARTQSVLRKSKISNLKSQKNSKIDKLVNSLANGNWKMEINAEELSLLRCLSRFYDVLKAAAKNYSPSILCNYLYDLASKFNSFYDKYRIIGSENLELRLRLTTAVGQVLKNGLDILGIETQDRM